MCYAFIVDSEGLSNVFSPILKNWSTFSEEETKSESQTVTVFFRLTEA